MTVLEQNIKRSKEALAELYKLKEVNKYLYESYCLKAVDLLQDLTRGR